MGLALRQGDGVMIPIPQYPLYTATLAYVSATSLPYYLQESDHWSLNHSVLVDTISKARESQTPVKALVIINPGNPTGACLNRHAIEQVIQLCFDERILLLADEVYQANIFDPENKPFVSFKKVLRSMPREVANGVEMVSFHSISKGVSGECGRRGGYFEAVNMSEEVMEQIYKMASISLCPPVTGQVRLLLLFLPNLPPLLLFFSSAFSELVALPVTLDSLLTACVSLHPPCPTPLHLLFPPSLARSTNLP